MDCTVTFIENGTYNLLLALRKTKNETLGEDYRLEVVILIPAISCVSEYLSSMPWKARTEHRVPAELVCHNTMREIKQLFHQKKVIMSSFYVRSSMSESLAQQVLRATERRYTVVVVSSNAEAFHMLITAMNWKVKGGHLDYNTVLMAVPSWDLDGETYWYNVTELGRINARHSHGVSA